MEKAVRLLTAAGVLMLLAGAIFGFMKQWGLAALIWVGALVCLWRALLCGGQDRQTAPWPLSGRVLPVRNAEQP